MDEVWAGIEQLTGRTLYTRPDREAFQVVSVNRSKAQAIQILTISDGSSGGEPRIISRGEIERAFNIRQKVDDLTPTIIQISGASVKNPEYIAAIFAAIEGRD
jgi:hypothetical protein